MMEDVMEDFSQLMRRLLEIQSGGRQSNPELIAEDERLMERLQKRNVVARPTQTVKLSQASPERAQFKA
jgi:hypothetical protein